MATNKSKNIDDLIPAAEGYRPAWHPKMVLELALGVEEPDDVLARYGVNEAEWRAIEPNPAFRRELAEMSRQVQEEGLSFKAKARIQAESYLMDLDAMVADRETPPSVRLEAIKSAVRWGELEPKKEKDGDGTGTTFAIQINF